MLACFALDLDPNSIPIIPIHSEDLAAWLATQNSRTQQWVKNTQFLADPGTICLVPGEEGSIQEVLFGIGGIRDFWIFGSLPSLVPEGNYHLIGDSWSHEHWQEVLMVWALGCYQFDLYRTLAPFQVKLFFPESRGVDELEAMITTIYLLRDMINMPAEVFGPSALAEAVRSVASEFGASVKEIVGEKLLEHNYPLIHAVGRAASDAPRLLDLRWGNPTHPKVTLVGKGVCYDTGGLSIKSTTGMILMKKDMGGAAHALALARLIMSAELPISLRLLIPAVENSISAQSYRPGDVIVARNGVSVEISNTDAEGRLILADALVEAMSDEPELVLDFATLTGAARTALGPEIPALMCNDDEEAEALLVSSEKVKDPIWRLPLYHPYRDMYLHSNIADICNTSSKTYAGAILAGLFLELFVDDKVKWAHFDLMAYNDTSTPGKPVGGEAMSLRACFDYLKTKFGS